MRKLFNNITEWIVHIPDAFRKSETEDEFGIRLRKHKRAMYIRTALLIVLGIALIFVLITATKSLGLSDSAKALS